MANPYCLVSARPRELERIANYARMLAGLRRGDAVIAIGSHRIVLMPQAVGCVLDEHPGKPIRAILEGMGAEGAWSIRQERLRALLLSREPSELNVGRAAPNTDDLVVDGYDWHVRQSRLVEAWKLWGGPANIDWKNIRIGQIDTGFRPHPCLGFDAVGRSGFVLTDFDCNFFPGDFNRDSYLDYGQTPGRADSALDPLRGGPHDGHGTRTGSVLAGFDETEMAMRHGLKGYYGAAPRVPYIPVRISDSVIINHVQEPLALAIEHLARHGCGVITLSMGMALTYVTERLKSALDHAYEQGVILVAAAGNVWDPVAAPARLRRTLAVGGCTPALTPWLGSSFGPEVDICAPAWPIRRGSVERGGDFSYGHGDGTSFATPQVAGAAALWLLRREDEIVAKYAQKWQRVEAFKYLVTRTAQPGVDWNRNLYGAGILDAESLLQAVLPDVALLVKDPPAG